MIYDGALAANGIAGVGAWLWCLVIGALILVWILVGLTDLGRINQVVMVLLFVLTLVMCKVIFFGGNGIMTAQDDSLSFGAAVELAVAMPLSWLPLISDYTREAEKPFAATLASTVTYGVVSCWMYLIGMGAAIYTGQSDIAQILLQAGLGVVGLLIVVFSTVTTTFLDAWSAGISAETIAPKFKGKQVALIVTVIGTVGAIVFPMDDITDFLYLIGSVFAPMIAVQIADAFILHSDASAKELSASRMIIWLVGFVIYRILMNIDFVLGNTLPDMLITMFITVVWGLCVERTRARHKIRAIPHNSKCRYGERGAADAKPKAQIILDVLSSILATQMPCRSCRSGACRKAGIVRCCLRNPHKMQKQSCQKLCFFRIHAKWYFIPVGRDALIPPQRNLADYDKRCK